MGFELGPLRQNAIALPLAPPTLPLFCKSNETGMQTLSPRLFSWMLGMAALSKSSNLVTYTMGKMDLISICRFKTASAFLMNSVNDLCNTSRQSSLCPMKGICSAHSYGLNITEEVKLNFCSAK